MSETATLQVVARVIARPDSVDAVKRILVSMLEPSREEEGCLVYELLQCQDDPTDFTFVETFESEEALTEHAAAPYIAGLAAKLEGVVARPAEVSRYHAIAADPGRSGG